MNIERVFGKPKLLCTLTSLDAGEFERLMKGFEAAWLEQRGRSTHAGQARQRKPGAGHKGTFKTAREKLFFVLFHFKCYPLQEVMALLFGLSQGQVSYWVGQLTPLVNAALGRELLLPARGPASLEALLQSVPELRLLILDGAERPIRRPRNQEEQKKEPQRQEEGPPPEEPRDLQREQREARGLSGSNFLRQRARQEAG